MESPQAVTPEERAAILAEWDRLAAEPRPAPPPSYGCATFFIAGLLFLLVHQLPGVTGWQWPSFLRTTLLWILGFFIAAGAFLGLFTGRGRFAHDSERAGESIAWLAGNPATGDAAARRRHAVTLLLFSVCSDDGPTTSGTYDPDEARKRLGAHLPYVLAVERVLAEERKMWPVFQEIGTGDGDEG